MTRVVAITDCDHDTVDPERAVLDGHDVELRRLQCRTPQEVADQAGDADVLINQYVPITAEVLDALPRCRLAVRYGVGVDNVDVEAAAARGIWVANVPDYGRDEVADHTWPWPCRCSAGWWCWTGRSTTASGTWRRPGRCAGSAPSPTGWWAAGPSAPPWRGGRPG